MENCLKLNFTTNLHKPTLDLDRMRILKDGFTSYTPEYILADEAMNQFQSMGLEPTLVLAFKSKQEIKRTHLDIGMDSSGNWRKYLFGINWEVDGSLNEFLWIKLDDSVQGWYPQPGGLWEHNQEYKTFNSLFFGETRNSPGIPEKSTIIERCKVDAIPLLVRTNIPHYTVMTDGPKQRLGFSVRFDESKFKDWDDVVQFFKPYELI